MRSHLKSFCTQFLFYPVKSVCVPQEDKKGKSGRSLNDESRDEAGDRRKGMFFSWSRNRSFGKGPKKRELADFNYSKCCICVLPGRLLFDDVTEGFCRFSLSLSFRFCWQQRSSGVPGFSVVRGQSGVGHHGVREKRGQSLSIGGSKASTLSKAVALKCGSIMAELRAHLLTCLVNELLKV